jgi:uncharacterized protein (DUF488 family)
MAVEPEQLGRRLMIIYTIGHSTHPIEKFIEMLKAHGVQLVADVRTIPRSRKNPQYSGEELAKSLKDGGIAYRRLPGLGGLRHARKDSINTGWEKDSFRGFADYMQTEEFAGTLAELIETAKGQRTSIMCAEALPWRCHRSLIADALTVRGVKVLHVMSKTSLREHVVTPWAEIQGTDIIYPKK